MNIIMSKKMKQLKIKSTLALSLSSVLVLSGCATATLLDKDDGVRTRNVQTVLVNDTVVAFGKPSLSISYSPSVSSVITCQQ